MEVVVSKESFADILEDDRRLKWESKYQYSLSCVGFVVGLGNVWRFPYLCQTYGGGAFLIPYLIVLVLEGIPLFHLELAIGQRLRKGSIGVWSTISPYLGGVGPIEECHQSTPASYFWYRKTLNITPDITESGSLQWWLILSLAASWIIVYISVIRGIETTGKVVYFAVLFPYIVLTIFLVYGLTLPGAIKGLSYLITPNVDKLNNPRAWLDASAQIFYSLSLGVGGHIAYSSYISPKNDCEIDAIVIAAVDSLTSLYASIPIFSLLGFQANIDHEKCLDCNIKDIVTAFNLKEQSITRTNYTIWVKTLNEKSPDKMTGLKLKNCDIEKYLDQTISGTGLAFIVFTEAIVHLPGSVIWAILFFVMLYSLGLSSMFGLVESILTPLLDFPIVAKSIPKEAVSGMICLSCFLLAWIFATGSGSYWLEIFDSYVATLPLLVIAFFEVVGVAYVYGIKRFSNDVKLMTGRRVNFYWEATWQIITPLLMFTIFVAYIALQTGIAETYGAWNPNYEGFPAKEKKVYPRWVTGLTFLFSSLPCIVIPIVAIYHLVRTVLKRKGKQVLHPSN
ncbi:inactive sodium-dependent neutral amino acid transporter B(0)AT3-like isoform X2 [Hemicordylus capensis]|uniref:inactive sodium-dependent neutral amino acid transporter B(0)AT3-like isoform X2 n=1 Tax=Hemicordylus capensis TaxID=884348 RepID=UPI0023022DB5|nr:inactive sodium-dependent neutral amino acid transporter B(0)AT3-like isoform X2 [Hemicordylus capensis]